MTGTLYVQSQYIWLKGRKHKNLVSLSLIYASYVKPFYANWYRRPGDLINPCSPFDVPNDCNIKESCAIYFNGKTSLLCICCPLCNIWYQDKCYEIQLFKFRLRQSFI